MENRELKFLEMEKEVNRRGGDGAAVVEAYRELYGMHEVGLCSWLAGLFDPDIGGFYATNSARNNIGYLPNIESTSQAMDFLRISGMLAEYGDDLKDGLPEWFQQQMIAFVKGLQDPNGYFYHPQWGTDIGVGRRSGGHIEGIRNSGKAVVSFNIACDKQGKDNGASFIPCVAWEKTGEFINNYFTKGSAIIVEGRLESRQPKAMPTSSRGSNFFTMPRYSSTQATAIIIRFFQPPPSKLHRRAIPESFHKSTMA